MNNLNRAIDACANRAREAVRVLEDYARFVLDQKEITEKLKRLRHELLLALKPLRGDLIAARNAGGDVGAAPVVASEYSRGAVEDIVRANASRLQEALRSLEEFAKISSPARAKRFERLRFRSYTLAQQLEVTAVRRQKLARLGVYAVLSRDMVDGDIEGRVRGLVKAGVDAVQLREKEMDDGPYIRLCKKLCKVVQGAGRLFFVNDRVHVCEIVDADGLHLGQDDSSVRDARGVVSPQRIIGLSTHSLAQARRAIAARPDYISVGPVFATPLKAFRPAVGAGLVERVAGISPLPIVGIGGIDVENASAVFAAGAWAVALSRPMCSGKGMAAMIKRLKRAARNAPGRQKGV